MLSGFGYIGLLLPLAIIFAASLPLLALTFRRLRVAPQKPNPEKSTTYECGMEPVGRAWVQFNFRYYLFAILFVALDVLTVFLYPWAVGFSQSTLEDLKPFLLGAMAVFILIITIGYVYAWKKKALEWN